MALPVSREAIRAFARDVVDRTNRAGEEKASEAIISEVLLNLGLAPEAGVPLGEYPHFFEEIEISDEDFSGCDEGICEQATPELAEAICEHLDKDGVDLSYAEGDCDIAPHDPDKTCRSCVMPT